MPGEIKRNVILRTPNKLFIIRQKLNGLEHLEVNKDQLIYVWTVSFRRGAL